MTINNDTSHPLVLDTPVSYPLDYDTMTNAGWAYHCNGVSGVGFFCRVVDSGFVEVVFDLDRPAGTPAECALIRVEDRTLTDTSGLVSVVDQTLDDSGRRLVSVFYWRMTGSLEPFIGVTDLDIDDEPATAVLSLERFPQYGVDPSYNAWRGDRVHRHLLDAWSLKKTETVDDDGGSDDDFATQLLRALKNDPDVRDEVRRIIMEGLS